MKLCATRNVFFNNCMYKAGDIIECNAEEAQALKNLGCEEHNKKDEKKKQNKQITDFKAR